MNDYRFTKLVAPGWEKTNQRAYLVIDRETGKPLGRVHDDRLWNMYDPFGDHWKAVHSDPDISGAKRSTRKSAAKYLWAEHKVPSFNPENEHFLPPANLVWAKNFDHESFFANTAVSIT